MRFAPSGLRRYVESYLGRAQEPGGLQAAVSTPARGYDIHHIVEQASAREDGFSASEVDGSDNLVRIPTLKHWEINAWYQERSDRFGGRSPREYLRGRSWDERRKIGLEALSRFGVLEP